MKHNTLLLTLVSMFFLFGCSAKPQIDIETTPKMQTPKTVAPVQKRKGALYTRSGPSLFADKKDLQVGDILQVDIYEYLNNKSDDDRSITKTATSQMGGSFSAPTTGSAGPTRLTRNLNNALGIGFNSANTNTFSGVSGSESEETFKTKISTIIEQVYANGNYFIKGSKEVLINGQKQNIKISGVIRPYDISPENVVESDRIANLKVLYEKEGSEIDALEKNWGTKLIDAISPF